MRITYPRRHPDGKKLIIEISLRVHDDTYADLKRRAKALGITMSELIRQYIAKAMA
jgi:antitoxin component of RelBE/YafQ-DinJ toxin-antitoxin module